MDDTILEAKPGRGRMTGGNSGGQQGAVDPNAALQKVMGSHGGKILGQEISIHAADIAIAALELAKKLEAAGLPKDAALDAAGKYVLGVAQQALAGAVQGKSR